MALLVACLVVVEGTTESVINDSAIVEQSVLAQGSANRIHYRTIRSAREAEDGLDAILKVKPSYSGLAIKNSTQMVDEAPQLAEKIIMIRL